MTRSRAGPPTSTPWPRRPRSRIEALRRILDNAAPTADQVNATFSDVQESLPQTLANLEVVIDMLKRYHNGVEQALVFLPQSAAIAQSVTSEFPGQAALGVGALSLNQPPPCLTGFMSASEWRAPADTSTVPLPNGTYCKIPMDAQNAVRGARNYPCADVPGKRAASPRECRSNQPYVPLGTNPWYGDPNQILTCPAPAARCDQPVKPGQVIPAPSVNNGENPLPADRVPGTPPPVSDPLQRPGSGTVRCNGQQPNPCIYTPSAFADIDLRRAERHSRRARRCEVFRCELEQHRRRRVEGDAGTGRLNLSPVNPTYSRFTCSARRLTT